ncbi:MAG: hypothetical protein DRJ42_28355 [Deltaproteobacteria bacterium]|nr:MAG: hypothetical protein DRJ42_28355 [Deltaproteobacteria bacterium]
MTDGEDKGTWIGVGISVAMLLLSLLACVITGVAGANMRESEAVQLSYLTVPVIFSGLVAWLPAVLLRKKGLGLAIGAPVGCGCLTGIFAGVGVAVFYVVLWPSL